MRRLLPLLSLALLLLLGACGDDSDNAPSESSSATQSGPIPGKVQDVAPTPVPDLTLETMDGSTIDLQAQEGRLLLVNFWATWCAPCREEIPALKKLHTDLRAEGLRVIGVALDRKGREVVAPFADKLGVNYPIVIDSEGTVEAEFGPIPGLPTTILVTPEGQITKQVVGIFPIDEMRSRIRAMLRASDAT